MVCGIFELMTLPLKVFREFNHKVFSERRKFNYKTFFEFIENSIIKHFLLKLFRNGLLAEKFSSIGCFSINSNMFYYRLLDELKKCFIIEFSIDSKMFYNCNLKNFESKIVLFWTFSLFDEHFSFLILYFPFLFFRHVIELRFRGIDILIQNLYRFQI